MAEKIFSIKLEDLVPSDLPSRSHWKRVKSIYPSDIHIPSTYLPYLGIRIIKTKRNLITPIEGNTRIARLTDLLGPTAIVTTNLDWEYIMDRDAQQLYDELIDDARLVGVYTYINFLAFISQGKFKPFRQSKFSNEDE